jgi:hypothetical protein
MRFPTQATSLQISTSHSQYLTAAEATATPIEDQPSLPKEGFATITATKIHTQTHRRIVWQTPNVVMDGVPNTFVTVTTNAESASFATAQHAALATGTPAGRPLLEPAEVGLPDWSPLLTIFLLTWVAMAWILALVIFLATFSEKVVWLDGLLRRRSRKDRHEYVRSKDDASDVSDFGHSALNPTASTNTYRSRKIRDLESSIQDTATVATGLGISFNGTTLNTPRLRRPRSFDRDSLRTHGPKSHANIASTAPLPSNRSFAELSPTSTDTSVHVKDLEIGDYESTVRRRPII